MRRKRGKNKGLNKFTNKAKKIINNNERGKGEGGVSDCTWQVLLPVPPHPLFFQIFFLIIFILLLYLI